MVIVTSGDTSTLTTLEIQSGGYVYQFVLQLEVENLLLLQPLSMFEVYTLSWA